MTTLVYPKTDPTVLEVVIYKLKKDYMDDFEDVLSEARSAIADFPGFIAYKTLRSMNSKRLFIDIVKWKSLETAEAAAKKVDEMKTFAPFMAAFEEILIMDHFSLFTDTTAECSKKLDLYKADKAYYSATEEPELLELPATNYLSIKGVSAPEDPKFLNAMEAIYSVIYNLKFNSKATGNDFIVPRMEGQWWVESELPFDKTPREDWHWNILIRLPDFINAAQVDKAVEEVIKKNNLTLASEVMFSTLHEGKCVQCLHVGSYEKEHATLEKIITFIREKHLEISGYHHEIYISDSRKTEMEKLKTIIRYPVKLLN